MSEEAIKPTPCPTCGSAIPPEAPQGLCPKCLLKQASFPTEPGVTTRHSRPAPPDRDELARAFPHLEILELIGQGGMGFVYKARQPKLDRLVALKILAQPLAEQTMFAERFTREGRTLAKLNHPNIVTIHDFGQAGPFFYLLMEYVDGVNLRQAMKAGAINANQALAIVPRICDALQYAHNEGVLHRDIKPDNILLDARGRVKIADFGIAKLMAEAVAENPLTGSGASLGTPHYMAPEQIEKPNAVDHRADIYSLGVVFYEMLTGELPLGRFGAPSQTPGIDPRLDDVVFQTLEKQPERRQQSADEVRTKVEQISSGGPALPREPEVTFKMAKCYLTTPQFLSGSLGRLLRYTNKGELRLDEETLTFAPRGNWIVIPLRSIIGMTMGDFPAGIGKVKFIAITFTEKGSTHRYFFIPTRGAFRSIFNTNELVEEWFRALQHAIKARTGKNPPESRGDLEALPDGPQSPRPGLILFKAAAFSFLFFLLFLIIFWLVRPASRNRDIPQLVDLYIPAAEPVTEKGPSRDLNIVSVYSTNNSNLALRTSTEPAAGERFVPVVRYGNGPWGESDATTTRLEYHRSSTGSFHDGIYTWRLPEAFNSGYEIAAAALRARVRATEGPITIWREGVTPIFDLTNSTSQVVSMGLRLATTPVPPPSEPIMATLTRMSGGLRSERVWNLFVATTPKIPAGFRIQAYGMAGTQEIDANTYQNGDTLWHFYSMPDEFKPWDFQNKNLGIPSKLEITYGSPVEIFSLTSDSGAKFRAMLELVPMPGIEPPQIMTSPAKLQPIPSGPTETVRLTFFQNTVEGSKISLQAIADLPIDQNVQATVISSASRGGPGGSSHWTRRRGDTDDQTATFSWTFPSTFSAQLDLLPALSNFFEAARNKTFHVALNETMNLFSLTNALGNAVTCAVHFVKSPAAVKTPAAGVIIHSMQPFNLAPPNGIFLNFSLSFPTNVQLQASGAFDGKPINAVLTRSMGSENAEIGCTWLFPEGFTPAEPLPQFSRGPGTSPGPLFEKLFNAIQSGDARVTAGKPLEVFALTNSAGKILRAFIELKELSSAAKKIAFKAGPIYNRQIVSVISEIDLALNESVIPLIRYGDSNWKPVLGYNKFRSLWGGSIDRRAELSWSMPDTFSPEFDLQPATRRLISSKPIILPENENTPVLTITNALGHKATLGVRYSRFEKAPSDPNEPPYTEIASLALLEFDRGLRLNLTNIPPDVRIEAISACESERGSSEVIRGLPEHPGPVVYLECRWDLPPNFRYADTNGLTLAPLKIPETLREKIRKHEAKITLDKPFELYTLTNNGKVLRATLEMTRLAP